MWPKDSNKIRDFLQNQRSARNGRPVYVTTMKFNKEFFNREFFEIERERSVDRAGDAIAYII